jgi:predicted TIM-barrel fold metal-dependent hydrolase
MKGMVNNMVIDINAYIGHYPFRKTRYKTAADLMGLMDKYGVDMCCVASLNAIYYKDCMEGNDELLEEIAPYRDRLVPFCVINPEYNNAHDDLTQCVKKMGFRGLRLFPKQQGYRLDGELSAAMLRTAGEMKIPVHVPVILEDLRGHHPMDPPSPIDAGEVMRAALLAPETDIVLSNAYLNAYAREIEPACKERAGGVYYDIGRIDCLFFNQIEDLAGKVGYERLCVGTGAILQNIPVQFVKLHYMSATMGTTPEQLELVKCGNIARLLNI